MKIIEIIAQYTIHDAATLLSKMGFVNTKQGKGSHNKWKHPDGEVFSIPMHGKELEYGISRQLDKIMKHRGLTT